MVDASLKVETLARLGRCLEFWQQQGFSFVELPWLAPARYTDATKPPIVTSPDLATPYGNLLASGEQAFLMLQEEGRLGPGSHFIGWTPCFRDELQFDATHHFYFLKAELFVRIGASSQYQEEQQRMVQAALSWLAQEAILANKSLTLELEQLSTTQVDILGNGLEVGSYGLREFAGQLYVYGTACAEPRFSQALQVNVS